MTTTELNVTNCIGCPFAENDNEFGYCGCSIKDIKLSRWEQLPSEGVHSECPLKEANVIVKLTAKK